jgi:hypothetical protein
MGSRLAQDQPPHAEYDLLIRWGCHACLTWEDALHYLPALSSPSVYICRVCYQSKLLSQCINVYFTLWVTVFRPLTTTHRDVSLRP